MKISDHITYAEAIHSNTAKRKRIDNTPNPTQVEAMKVHYNLVKVLIINQIVIILRSLVICGLLIHLVPHIM